MLLSRTTRFLTGLASRLVGFDDRAGSAACTLPDLRCLRSVGAAEAADEARARGEDLGALGGVQFHPGLRQPRRGAWGA